MVGGWVGRWVGGWGDGEKYISRGLIDERAAVSGSRIDRKPEQPARGPSPPLLPLSISSVQTPKN